MDEHRDETRTSEPLSPAEGLASEFLDAYAAGKDPSTVEWAGRLETEEDREEFRRILGYAMTVESFPPTLIQVGETFGPYRIEGKLGEGGMGTVFRATDTRLPREVAIKVLPPEKLSSEMYQKRLEVESQVLARLNHPNIVTVHEAGLVGGVRFIVMDHVDGVRLDHVLRKLATETTGRRWGRDLAEAIGKEVAKGRKALIEDADDYWTAVARIMREIVRAVEAAHGECILHRDLKPGNVILTGGGIPIVLDFGLASSNQVEAGTVSQRLIGSVPYFAPEQVRDMKVGFDFRTDVYQLGLVLYEMLTLQRAFPHETLQEALHDIRFGQFKAPRRLDRSIPRELETICLAAIEPEIERRYSDAAALGTDLDRFLEGLPPLKRRPSVVRRLELFGRRNRKPLTAAAAALVIGGAGAWWYWKHQPVDPPHLTPFIVRLNDPQPFRIAPTSVRDGDLLGGDVRLPTRMVVFAVSVVGERAGQKVPQYVRVLHPQLKEEGRMQKTDPIPPGRPWDAGRYSMLFGSIRASHVRGSPEDWREGLWVFFSVENPAWLRQWIEALQKEERDLEGTEPGVSFSKAMALLTKTRSSGDVELTPDQWQRLDQVLERREDPAKAWPFEPKPVPSYFPLDPK